MYNTCTDRVYMAIYCIVCTCTDTNPPLYCIISLGLLSDELVQLQGTPLRTLSAHLEKQLTYGVFVCNM